MKLDLTLDPSSDTLYQLVRTVNPMPVTGHHHLIIARKSIYKHSLIVSNLICHPTKPYILSTTDMSDFDYAEFITYATSHAPFPYVTYEFKGIPTLDLQIVELEPKIRDVIHVSYTASHYDMDLIFTAAGAKPNRFLRKDI